MTVFWGESRRRRDHGWEILWKHLTCFFCSRCWWVTYTPRRCLERWSSAPCLRFGSDTRSLRSQRESPGWCSTPVRGVRNQRLCSWTRCNRPADQPPSRSRPGVRSGLRWSAWMDLLQPWPHWRSLERRVEEQMSLFIYIFSFIGDGYTATVARVWD